MADPEQQLVNLIQQTYVNPSPNQTEILSKWKTIEFDPSLPALLLNIASNSKYNIIIRTSSLLSLKNIIENTKTISESMFASVISLLCNSNETHIRKASAAVFPTMAKFAPESLIIEFCRVMEKYVGVPEVVLAGCNILEDFVEAGKAVKILLHLICGLIASFAKFPSLPLAKLVETYGTCVFENFEASAPYLPSVLPVICQICVYSKDSTAKRHGYIALSTVFDKEKAEIFNICPNIISETVVYGIEVNKEDYSVKLSACEFLLHILEEGPELSHKIEPNLEAIIKSVVPCTKYTEHDLLEYDDSADPSLQNTKIDPNWTLRRCAVGIITKLFQYFGSTKVALCGLAGILQSFVVSATVLDPLELEIGLLLTSMVEPETLFNGSVLNKPQSETLKGIILHSCQSTNRFILSTALWTLARLFASPQPNPINLALTHKDILSILLNSASHSESQIREAAVSAVTFVFESCDPEALAPYLCELIKEKSLKYLTTTIQAVISKVVGLESIRNELNALSKTIIGRIEEIATKRKIGNPPDYTLLNALESICESTGFDVETEFMIWEQAKKFLSAYANVYPGDESIRKDKRVAEFIISQLDLVQELVNRDPKLETLRAHNLVSTGNIQEFLIALAKIMIALKEDLALDSSIYSLMPELMSFAEAAVYSEIATYLYPKVKSQVEAYAKATIDPGDRLWGATNNGVWCLTRLMLEGCNFPFQELIKLLHAVFAKSLEEKPPLSATIGICVGILLEKIKPQAIGEELKEVVSKMAREAIYAPAGEETVAAAK